MKIPSKQNIQPNSYSSMISAALTLFLLITLLASSTVQAQYDVTTEGIQTTQVSGAPNAVLQNQLPNWAQNTIDEQGLTNALHFKYGGGANPQYVLIPPVTFNNWNPGILSNGIVNTGEPKMLITYENNGNTTAPTTDFDCQEADRIGGKNNQTLASFDCKSMFNQADSDALYQCAIALSQIGALNMAFDSMRVFCERYSLVSNSIISLHVGDGIGNCGGYPIGIKRKTKSGSTLYLAYNWLVYMQPKNSECGQYQAGIFNGLATLLGREGFNDPNEQCNMWWNYIQLCHDHGWRDSMHYGFIRQTRKYQTQDTTPFYLYTYPLKSLLSVAQEHNNPEDLIEALLQPNPTIKQTTLQLSLNKSA